MLSNKIFIYLLELFNLDITIKLQALRKEKNTFRYRTSMLFIETRTSVGLIALRYIFSKDFDLAKRYIL